MIKNYSDHSFEHKWITLKLQPQKRTIDFVLNYSKSLDFVSGTVIDEIRFDKN
ncbi:MAG: hypothetical protein ACN4EF_03880 [Wenyingzhuangia sp.]|jgi:hypothetical protein|uniref:hypothetical protein n=1 Tax=Wenyingzhuangia sp. TaxID=1964193 RepID=UPI003218EA83